MGVQTVTGQLVQGGLTKLLQDALRKAADVNVDGLLGGLHVGLFTAWPGFSEGLVAADLTEATFGGYARQAAVWGTQGLDPEGRPEVIAASLVFSPTDSSASSRGLGIGLYSAAAGGTLYGVGTFDAPITLSTADDDVNIVVKIAMPIDAADWGIGAAVE